MYCKYCGSKLDEQNNVCHVCGSRNIDRSQYFTPNQQRNTSAKSKKKNPLKTIGKTLLIILGIIGAFFIILMIIPTGDGNDSYTAPASTQTETPPPPSREEIKSFVSDIDYKDFLRYPEKYRGAYLVLELEVSQIMYDANSKGETYIFGRVDDDGSGWYLGDEYCILDKRVDDNTKILDGDIVTAYGQFISVETFTATITKQEQEIPIVSTSYIDIME